MTNHEHDPKAMTSEELTLLGVSKMVYVKPILSQDIRTSDIEGFENLPDDVLLYSVHTADGTAVALLDDRDTAFAAARQYSMEPVSVH